MKHILNVITILTVLLASSCVKNDYVKEANYDFKTNYEAFWNLVNEKYCYISESYGYYKKVHDENGVAKKLDWKAVYDEMMPRVEAAQTEEELLDIMGASIDYLQDGHVWITTKFRTRGCYTFYYTQFPNPGRYPINYISGLINKDSSGILDYVRHTRNGHVYGNIIRDGKRFFYISHKDFNKTLNEEDLEMIVPHIEKADGIIYDIRTNGGGNAQYAFDIAGMFVKEKTHIGYQLVKKGSSDEDFLEPTALYVTPSKGINWSDINTAVLTNRDVYSTANMFASFMKEAPNATVIGGITGGGGGDPTSFYLPNGWTVVISAYRMSLDVDKQHIEAGVEPDIHVDITEKDIAENKDRILEKAIEVLSE